MLNTAQTTEVKVQTFGDLVLVPEPPGPYTSALVAQNALRSIYGIRILSEELGVVELAKACRELGHTLAIISLVLRIAKKQGKHTPHMTLLVSLRVNAELRQRGYTTAAW